MFDLYFNQEALENIDQAYDLFNPKEFASPTRSTIPLVSLIKHGVGIIDSINEEIGMQEKCRLHLEYQVPVQKGKGRASHTDLMLINDRDACAAEAKWTECRYEPAGDWIDKGDNAENRYAVLSGWLDILASRVQHRINPKDFYDIEYQMIHRAASACFISDNPKLVYLVFLTPDHTSKTNSQRIFDDLSKLWNLLGEPENFPFYQVDVLTTPTSKYDEIKDLPKESENTAKTIKQLLSNKEELFKFNLPFFTKIGE